MRQLDGTGMKRLHREWRRRTEGRLGVVLDNVEGPFNVGAVIRTAAAMRAEDVVARYGTQAMGEPLRYDSRDAVVAFMTENLGPGVITIHIANHPEIDVDGDAATGSWAFEDTVIVPEHKVQIRGGGYYHDEYRRDPDGRWRVSATRCGRPHRAVPCSLRGWPASCWGSSVASSATLGPVRRGRP